MLKDSWFTSVVDTCSSQKLVIAISMKYPFRIIVLGILPFFKKNYFFKKI